MSTILVNRPEFLNLPHDGFRNHRKFHSISASWTMTMDSNSSRTANKGDLSIQVPRPSIPHVESLRSSDMRFDRLQPSDEELLQQNKFEFGRFVAREAVLDEEYWTAAWLRAESHWEDRTDERYVDSHKRKFAEQEFNAIKRRYRGQHGQKYMCMVTCSSSYNPLVLNYQVKKEEKNVKRTVLKSVVGTLDLSVRHLLQGETFPGERIKGPFFCCINKTDPNRYGYVANLCVVKSGRRQGIASNMLHFALELAKSNDVQQVYVHVHKNNRPAQELYQKMGFKMVEKASSQLLEQPDLLCIKL